MPRMLRSGFSTRCSSPPTPTAWCAPIPAACAARIDLGISLVGTPRLLLLDEPSAGLDPGSRIRLWDAIRGLVVTGTDILLTTQYLDEADRLASDIVIIDHGKVVAAGTPAELKTRAGDDMIEVHVHDADDLPAVSRVLAKIGHDPRVDVPTRRAFVSADNCSRVMYPGCAPGR